MRNENKTSNGLLIVAVVAIVAIVSLTMFFSTNNTSGAVVDAAINDIQGVQNTAGSAISAAKRDCLHRKCDSTSNQQSCVNDNWDVCG